MILYYNYNIVKGIQAPEEVISIRVAVAEDVPEKEWKEGSYLHSMLDSFLHAFKAWHVH